MKQISVSVIWAGAAFCTALALAAASLEIFGTETSGLNRGLQVTGRFSFILFWFAYAGGALKTLFGPAFQMVAWRGRDFGLAFAAAHLVYLGLFIWLYQISPEPPLAPALLWFCGIGVLWIYGLAALSIGRFAHTRGHVRWRILRATGMEYISFVFLFSFINHPLNATIWSVLLYVPFAALSVIGTFLRLTAWASRGANVTKRA
jgi:hypothetical protein